MKTTLELPDDLLVAAKKRAAELRKPLRELIESGLRSELSKLSGAKRRRTVPQVRWVTAAGGLPVDVSDREAMYTLLQRDKLPK